MQNTIKINIPIEEIKNDIERVLKSYSINRATPEERSYIQEQIKRAAKVATDRALTAENEYKVTLEVDEWPADPREWDTLGTLLLSRNGDDLPYTLEGLCDEVLKNCYISTANLPQFILYMSQYIKQQFNATVVLPVFEYSHGANINLSIQEKCQWDSSFIGFTFDTYETRKEWGLVEATPEEIEDRLKYELKTYSDYLNGDTYCVYLIDINTEEEEDYSGTIYGYDDALQSASSLAEQHGAELVENI